MTIVCPVCKANSSRTKYRLRGYRIDECTSCGLQFNADFRGGGGNDDLFSEDYYKTRHREAFASQFDDYRSDASFPVYVEKLVEIERHIRPGRVLDVGSALGTFLLAARDRGWEPHGVEISEFAARHAREKHKLPVFHGDLASFEGAAESFDLVTFWDSIEHVATPLEDAAKAVELLKPGGIVLFTTDNFDCLIADVAKVLYRLTAGRVNYPVERVFIDANLSFFTVKTFRDLLSRVGLKEIYLEKMEYPLEKIKAGFAERLALRTFYALGKVLHRQAQITVLARKEA